MSQQKVAPICDYSTTKTRYEVAVNQPVKIDCNVLAEPADDIHFVWQFNQTLSNLNPMLDPNQLTNSAALSLNSYRVDEVKQYETNFTKSYVIFTPKTKRHYAQFLCSASNSFGKQDKPCVISVFPSDLPEPVFGCFTDDVTKSSFSIHCQARASSLSRQNYLLELYTTSLVDNTTSINKKETSIQRQENTNNSNLKQREEGQNGPDDQQPDFSGDDKNEDQQQQQQQQQLQVKKINSETSTFHLNDLKPDTSYNVVIYVQNSKGRSAPFYHQTTTLPASTSDMTSPEGQIQFINKRQPAEANLADKLISYLPKMSEYLSSDNTKPLIGIGLAILLCTISVIVLTFFITRSCRPKGKKRARCRSNSTNLSQNGPNNINKLDVYDIREPRLERNVQLGPATTARLKNGLAGSGSDTSRETNTESTLISSINQSIKNKHSTDIERKQSDTNDNEISPMKKIPIGGEEVLVNNHHHQVEKRYRQTPIMLPENQQQALQGLYSTVKRTSTLSSPLEIDHSNTPQVSIKSSSDCTSNNEIQQVDNPDQFYRDQLLVKCRDNQMSEPVYVIDRNGSAPTPTHYYPQQNYQLNQSQQQTQPLRLLDPSGFWPYSDPGEQNGGNMSCRTQVSSAETGDSFERTLSTTNNLTTPQNTGTCQLIRDHPGSENVTPVPFSFLPSSMSIPVSLSDCFQQLDRDTQQQRMSQNLLSGELCIANTNNGPYLTLTPNDHHHHHARCHQQQQQTIRYDPATYDCKTRQQVSSLLPPENFSSHHAFYCDDFGGQKNSQNECPRVGSNQDHYFTQTLDDTFRQARSRVASHINNQTIDARRGSCDGEFSGLMTNIPSRHHVKFEAQNNQPCDSDGPHTGFMMHNNNDIGSQEP